MALLIRDLRCVAIGRGARWAESEGSLCVVERSGHQAEDLVCEARDSCPAEQGGQVLRGK